MSILKLLRDRQMYKHGKRVGFRGGGMDMGNASNQAQSANMGGGSSNNNTGGGNDNKVDPGFQNALRTQSIRNDIIENQNNTDYGQFFGSGVPTFSPPTFGQQVGNVFGGIGNYIKGGGLIGMGIRGLDSLFDKVTGPKATEYGNLDVPGYNMLNIAGPKSYDFGPEGQGGGDNQGIMAAYNPYTLPVEEEVPVSQEEEDFTQRFRVANKFRQDKKGQLDPAILEMISKLYT